MIEYWRQKLILKLPPFWIMDVELLEPKIQNELKTMIKRFYISNLCSVPYHIVPYKQAMTCQQKLVWQHCSFMIYKRKLCLP